MLKKLLPRLRECFAIIPKKCRRIIKWKGKDAYLPIRRKNEGWNNNVKINGNISRSSFESEKGTKNAITVMNIACCLFTLNLKLIMKVLKVSLRLCYSATLRSYIRCARRRMRSRNWQRSKPIGPRDRRVNTTQFIQLGPYPFYRPNRQTKLFTQNTTNYVIRVSR